MECNKDALDVPVLDDDAAGECLMLGLYMVFDPEAGCLIQWPKQVERTVLRADEIGTARRGTTGSYERIAMRRHSSSCEEIFLRKYWERTLGGFLPYEAVSLHFRRKAPQPFGSVAGRLKAPSLLILCEVYLKTGRSTTIGKSWAFVRHDAGIGANRVKFTARNSFDDRQCLANKP